MPFKTILAHIAHDDRYRDRSMVALDLAERFSAHLSLLYTAHPVHVPAARPGAAPLSPFWRRPRRRPMSMPRRFPRR